MKSVIYNFFFLTEIYFTKKKIFWIWQPYKNDNLDVIIRCTNEVKFFQHRCQCYVSNHQNFIHATFKQKSYKHLVPNIHLDLRTFTCQISIVPL